MSLQRIVKKLVLLVSSLLALTAGVLTAYADGPSCATCASGADFAGTCGAGGCCSLNGCCPGGRCPPPLVHCTPKPPKIKFKCVCGKPVCNPCDLEGYGYNPTCWRPWLPPLSCGNLPVPALGCSLPGPFPGVNADPKQPVDVLPPPNKGTSDTPRSEQKPGEKLPPGPR